MRICFFLLIILYPAFGNCQKNDWAIILDTPLHFIKPDKFYIDGVIDSRSDKSLDGLRIRLQANQKLPNDTLPVSNALLLLLNKCLAKDTSLVPVTINIREFSIVPSGNSGLPKDVLKIDLRYQTVMDKNPVDFAYYSFSQGMYKYMKTSKYLSELFRRELPELIIELNRFVNNSFGSFPYKGIRVTPYLSTGETSLADTLFYRRGNKLSWNDFKGKPELVSHATAVAASGFDYLSLSEIKNGYLNVSVILKCFFLPQASWVNRDQASANGLLHEQLHFDIAYLEGLKFINAIAKANFSVAKWQYELEELNETRLADMKFLQETYDKETKHGNKEKMQIAWQKKIQVMIKESLP